MEAKVLQVTTQGVQPLVVVGFFEGDVQKGESKYLLDPGQTLDDIKPNIKEYLNLLVSAVDKAKSLEAEVEKNVDLKGVKSTSELRKEAEDAAIEASKNVVQPVEPGDVKP